MPNHSIPVQALDFDTIKTNLKSFLSSQTQFQDYNFEGSSLSILLDLLAYTTHYNGFHAHMLNNESNIDSAYLISSMFSKAKFQNYIPGSRQSAQSIITVTAGVTLANAPIDQKIIIPRGQTLSAVNNATDTRTFTIIDDLYIYNQSQVPNVFNYTSDEVSIFEGTFEEEKFVVDATLTYQRYVIQDRNIDIKSLNIHVFETETDIEFQVFKVADDFMAITGASPVFFITVNEDGLYEVQFGNGTYGRDVQNGNLINMSFVSSNGALGNNAKQFNFDGDITYNGETYSVTANVVSSADGGVENESLDELRFNIPYHFRRQNRGVVVDDYKNILLSEYRNINSINVWGGEDNVPPEFGKVFICIKPKFGDFLSNKAKTTIIDQIIRRRNIVAIDVEIVDPDFLYVNLVVNIQYNPLNTNAQPGQIITDAQTAIDAYNNDVLNRFGGFYSDLDLSILIKESNPAILTLYSNILLEKRITPTFNTTQTYTFNYLNPITAGTIRSDDFIFNKIRSYFVDDGAGVIHIWFFDSNINAFIKIPDAVFGTVDYSAGIIRLISVNIEDLYNGKTRLAAKVSPTIPDFFTKLNNIVSIESTTINIVENFENENEK